MTDDRPIRLHRIVQTDPPSAADFSSKAQLGIPCPVSDPDVQRRWTGLSLFGSEAQARRVVRRLPMLGSYMAALDIPPSAGMRAEPTLGPGHYVFGGGPDSGPPSAGLACPDPSCVGTGCGGGATAAPGPSFQYEVWELASRSLVATYPSEAEAIALVRQLFDGGWAADDLVLAAENERVEPEDLPPPLTGDALTTRATDSERGWGGRSP